MEVILLEKVGRFGVAGDIVTVKDGYGRNYLLPQKKALRATKANKAYFEEQKAAIQAENEKKRQEAQSSLSQFEGVVVSLVHQAGEDGRLFGSATSREIARAISEKTGQAVKHTSVVLADPIKYIGTHPVTLSLHPEVNTTVQVVIARSESEAEELQKEALKKQKKGDAAPAEAEGESTEAA